MKTYVLDTNVLMNDPNAMYMFDNNTVIIPITVVEEIDKHKKDQTEVGRNARQASRNLDELMKRGLLNEGVKLDNGGTLRVSLALGRTLEELLVGRLPIDLDGSIPDNRILAVAIQEKATLVTKDTNLRIKASGLGIPAEDYLNTKVNVDSLYTGADKIAMDDDSMIDDIYKEGSFTLTNHKTGEPIVAYPNQCFVAYSETNPKKSALVRYDSVMQEYKLLPKDLKTLGLSPKNAEQQFSLDLLLDPTVNLVTLIGLPGSGKTLMALAAALHGVMETQLYKKVLLLKPVISMDNDHQLGFLPGSMEEKLAPWMASYYDNIEFIMGYTNDSDEIAPITKTKGGKKMKKSSFEDDYEDRFAKLEAQKKTSPAEMLVAHNFLEIGSLEHIRGRSLPNQYIIVDEAQNLTQHSIKTIITRAGEGTKIVLLGDISQIDAPYLDASSNGLTYVAERFKEQKVSGHITLMHSVRSELAELASNLL